MNRVSDGDVNIENRQQPIDTWSEEFAAETGATAAVATTLTQESDWVEDFAEHKAKQGKFFVKIDFTQLKTILK